MSVKTPINEMESKEKVEPIVIKTLDQITIDPKHGIGSGAPWVTEDLKQADKSLWEELKDTLPSQKVETKSSSSVDEEIPKRKIKIIKRSPLEEKKEKIDDVSRSGSGSGSGSTDKGEASVGQVVKVDELSLIKTTSWYQDCEKGLKSTDAKEIEKVIVRCQGVLEHLRKMLGVQSSWPTSDRISIQSQDDGKIKSLTEQGGHGGTAGPPIVGPPITMMKTSVWIQSWIQVLRFRSMALSKLKIYHLALYDLCMIPDEYMIKQDLVSMIVAQKKLNFVKNIHLTYLLLAMKDQPNAENWKKEAEKSIQSQKELQKRFETYVEKDKLLIEKSKQSTLDEKERQLLEEHWQEIKNATESVPCSLYVGPLFHEITQKTLMMGQQTSEYLKKCGLEMRQDKDGIWKCFAKKDFTKGDLLFRESPLIFHISSKMYCSFCAKPIKNDKKEDGKEIKDEKEKDTEARGVWGDRRSTHCRKKCLYSNYCNTTCESNAWNRYHGALCGLNMDPIYAQATAGKEEMLEKVWLILKLMGTMLRSNSFPCTLFSWPELFIQHMLNVLKLQMQHHKLNYDELDLFINSISYAMKQGKIEELFIFDAKFFGVALALIKRFSTSLMKEGKKIGMGIYRFLSVLSHQCLSNTICTQDIEKDGNICSLVANASIKQGEEITISYVPMNLLSDSHRRKALLKEFGLICNCGLCTMGGPAVPPYPPCS